MCLTLNFRIEEKASTWRNTKLTTHQHKEVTEGRNVGEKKTGRWCLSQGPKKTNSGESEVCTAAIQSRVTVTLSAALYPPASPAWPQRAEQSRQQHCHSTHTAAMWAANRAQPTHCWAQQLWGGLCSSHGTPAGHCKQQPPTQPVLCTPEPNPGAAATASVQGSSLQPSCSAPATCTPGVPTAFATDLPHSPCLTHSPPRETLGAAPFPSTNRKQGCHVSRR